MDRSNPHFLINYFLLYVIEDFENKDHTCDFVPRGRDIFLARGRSRAFAPRISPPQIEQRIRSVPQCKIAIEDHLQLSKLHRILCKWMAWARVGVECRIIYLYILVLRTIKLTSRYRVHRLITPSFRNRVPLGYAIVFPLFARLISSLNYTRASTNFFLHS